MPNHTAYVNIGSNTGDRPYNINRAVACIADAFPDATVTKSTIVESEAWGYNSENKYLNIGLAIEFDRQPEPSALLRRLLAIEKTLCNGPHRNADGSYRDRQTDIDLIAIDSLTSDTQELTLPHPRMHLREFVLIPMIELAPEWRHPLTGLSCAQMLSELRGTTCTFF